ncbi:hypothetical protein GGQ99_002379 [Aminobacter niigataensis]|uniref:Phage abortive infection protein n=1 Tax=Aminobacter niigataensis TaxID=83265 RepID=A0ABR6L355_9HYPH|nr:putative phage abortive infection protein [Aminobacter niigataensis]MBB4650624.1 hypothetical protein [Aminobacter niigataensis]
MSAQQTFLVVLACVLVFIFLWLRSDKIVGQTWFEQLIDPEKGDTAGSFYKILFAALVFALTIFIAAVLLFTSDLKFTDNWAPGTFGDFIGGVLNPFLTFLTFLGLLVTIVLQQHEIREARKDAKELEFVQKKQMAAQQRQSFEATFFQMLTVHNTIVNSMDVRGSRYSDKSSQAPNKYRLKATNQEYKSRDCFQFFTNELHQFYDNYASDNDLDEVEKINQSYSHFWLKHQGDLGHYFRYLFNVVRFIDENAPPADDTTPDKRRYMKLLRAQLSDFELLMIFYNCLTNYGEDFKRYVEQYTLLNNFPPNMEFKPEHKLFFNESAYHEASSDHADTVIQEIKL